MISCRWIFNLRKPACSFKTKMNEVSRSLFHSSTKLKRRGLDTNDEGARSLLYYFTAGGVLIAGLSYAAVPMYRIFCQTTGMGGETQIGHDSEKVAKLSKRPDRTLTVKFTSDTAAGMLWNFKPQQSELKVIPGETALAFYTATNPTDKPIVGVSTYNVIPYEAGQYFNKIQCFCFEEQMLNPHEQVDMPVFFYIDPEYDDDPKLYRKDEIILAYTFFEAKEGFKMPIPGRDGYGQLGKDLAGAWKSRQSLVLYLGAIKECAYLKSGLINPPHPQEYNKINSVQNLS